MSLFKLSANVTKPTMDMKTLFAGVNVAAANKKKNILFKGAMISEFIEIFSKLPDISKLVLEKDDSTGLWGVYKDFMKLVTNSIEQDQELASYSSDQKEKTVAYIRNHVMFKLYPLYFLL